MWVIDSSELSIDNMAQIPNPANLHQQKQLAVRRQLRAGRQASVVMSLMHSARMNGHKPQAYLRDVLQRLSTQSASRVTELLPPRWTPCQSN